MRYALVNDEKAEAQPKLKGRCPNCDGHMIAKCGRVKVWHWAHKGRPPCDPWWESETEWHRAWKNKFPTDWQEVSHINPETGEKHIADVKNPHGLVIELQHSPIDPVEMRSREEFYGKMIWIVDGTRGLDAGHFRIGLEGPIQKNPLAYRVKWWGRSQLLRNWSEAKAKVYVDFGEEMVWRLVLFDRTKKMGVVGPLSKETLIEDCNTGADIRVSYIID